MGIVTGYLSQLVTNGIKLYNGSSSVSVINPLPIIDGGQGAIFDNGLESGAIRNHLVSGNVVLMPFKPNTDLYLYGTTTASIVSTSLGNATGTGTVLSATIAASAGESQVDMRIKGRKFGLLIQKASVNGAPISCLIDGVAYVIDTTWNANQRTGSGNAGLSDSVYQYTMIADDLDDGDHFVELVFPKNASASSRSYRIQGYVVDAAAGYVAPERGCVWAVPEAIPVISSGTWPTSVAGAVADLGQSSGVQLYGHLGYNIVNDTAGSISFRVMSASSGVTRTVLLKTLTAGDTYEWRFPKTMYRIDSSLFWVASAAGLYTTGIQAI